MMTNKGKVKADLDKEQADKDVEAAQQEQTAAAKEEQEATEDNTIPDDGPQPDPLLQPPGQVQPIPPAEQPDSQQQLEVGEQPHPSTGLAGEMPQPAKLVAPLPPGMVGPVEQVQPIPIPMREGAVDAATLAGLPPPADPLAGEQPREQLPDDDKLKE